METPSKNLAWGRAAERVALKSPLPDGYQKLSTRWISIALYQRGVEEGGLFWILWEFSETGDVSAPRGSTV